MFDLWKPTGRIIKHSAVNVEVNTIHVVLREETVRQLKARVRGGNSYTLVHILTLTYNTELVQAMCPENQRSIDDCYNVADAL
ncbi:MAG: hypothetical protein ACKPKO_60890, partial [Candidatus Fonsibacter sp.]